MSTHFKPRCLPNAIVGSALGSRVQEIICSTEMVFASSAKMCAVTHASGPAR
jgi:hypothetical protein